MKIVYPTPFALQRYRIFVYRSVQGTNFSFRLCISILWRNEGKFMFYALVICEANEREQNNIN